MNFVHATLTALNANPHMSNRQLYDHLREQAASGTLGRGMRVPGTLPGAVFAAARRSLGITAPTGRQGGPAHIDVRVWEAAAKDNGLPFTRPPAPGEAQPTVPATVPLPLEAGDTHDMRTQVATLQKAMATLGITKLVVTQAKFEVTRTYKA